MPASTIHVLCGLALQIDGESCDFDHVRRQVFAAAGNGGSSIAAVGPVRLSADAVFEFVAANCREPQLI